MKPEPDPTGGAPASRSKPHAGAEAARYGLIRRLGPVLKHDMVVNLQALSMMAEVLNARLERSAPSPAELQANIAKLNRLAREAVGGCLKVAAWIEPGEDQGVRLRQGIEECVGLLASNFTFRGIAVKQEVADGDFQVWRAALQHLLVASLITLTDAAAGPCEIRLKAEVVDGLAEISLQLGPRHDDVEAIAFEPAYRHLDWADVQALAQAESVELVRSPERIVMRMPRAVATAPLQIAPV